MNLPIPFALDPIATTIATITTRRIKESITTLIENLRYNMTTPLSFETYPEDYYTAPLIREHHDSYL